MNASLANYFRSCAAEVDKELKTLLKRHPDQPETIRRAMSYSLFAGGKRLRPILVMAAAECCGAPARRVSKTAAAMEMIHTYSLIHDDLPAMDDDDLRRGKPTNHKVFGEAVAILAGDALLTYAFEAAAANAAQCRLNARSTAELISVISQRAGAKGMVGGQVADLEAENWKLKTNGHRVKNPAKLLEYIHKHKTAALIAASLEAGVILAGGNGDARGRLRAYGLAIGLAFQIADDILDVVGDKRKMGKKGSDTHNHKLTYASLYGIEAARKRALDLVKEAHKSLAPFGRHARMLHDLADYIIMRDR